MIRVKGDCFNEHTRRACGFSSLSEVGAEPQQPLTNVREAVAWATSQIAGERRATVWRVSRIGVSGSRVTRLGG